MMLFTALALSLAAPLQAGATALQCPAKPAPLPPELSGWVRMTPVVAGADVPTAATLTLGTGARATLVPTSTLRYAHTPPKPDPTGSSGGLFSVTIAFAGRYRFAIGGDAWVDLLSGSRVLSSAAHGHGPACSPVRKTVDFDLAPGRYVLQITGSKSPTLPLFITPVSSPAAPPHPNGHGGDTTQG